jgi:hypothetical protein
LVEEAKRSVEREEEGQGADDEEMDDEEMDDEEMDDEEIEREEMENEEMENEEMADDVDEAIEEMEKEGNRTAEGISELELLTNIQKASLTFCIALLRQPITRKEYDSPMVCALAVLGVKEDGWKGPEQYSPILLAVIKVARFLLVQQALELLGLFDEELESDSAYESDSNNPQQRPRKGCLQFVQEMID